MSLSNESKQDLRSWIAAMDAAGQLQHVSGAEHEREIGGIVDVYQRKIGNKALLFDDIPGFPKGFRILSNVLTSVPRINMTIGRPANGSANSARASGFTTSTPTWWWSATTNGCIAPMRAR